MTKELKNHWFTLRLLLIVNIVFVALIFFVLGNNRNTRHSDCSEQNTRHLSTDALNSITIKLM